MGLFDGLRPLPTAYIIPTLGADGRHLALRGYGGFDRVPMLPSPDEAREAIRDLGVLSAQFSNLRL